MSYRLAYWVVWIVTAIITFAVIVALNGSTWVSFVVPMTAFILFPKEWVAKRLATTDKNKTARWDPPAPESRADS